MADFTGNKTRLLPITALAPMGTQNIRDIATSFWFGPLQPIQPVAPANYRPRQYAYQIGANITWQPKADEAVGYEVLRELADSWDLLRIIITTQLDRICSCEWEIREIEDPKMSKQDRQQKSLTDPNIADLKNFFRKPDGFHPWKSWIRMFCEDMLVIDAVALYLARDKSGKVATIHPIAGDTINRLMTDQGITPPPPSPAYQQVIYGQPVWNFTTDDLLFAMRNERTNKRYGFSPVEQIIRTVCFGLRRQEWQIAEYTSGNVPEALVFLPSDLPIDRVKEVQDWFDSILSGDLQQRRRVRFLPGYGTGDQAKPNIIFPKEPLLKDELDVWLAQVACYCIGVSAQPFMKMMNRASAEQAQETSEEEGLKPYTVFVKDLMNDLIQDKMGYANYEFVWAQQRTFDPVKQATTDNLLAGKIYTINELRAARGEDPRPEPQADMLGVFGAGGFIPLDTPPPQPGMMGPGMEPGMEPGGPGESGPPNGKPPQKPKGPPTQKIFLLSSLSKEFNETEPRDDSGKWTSDGGFSAGGGVTLTSTTERAWPGKQVYISPKNMISKLETGHVAESIVLTHLHKMGLSDARPLNREYPNYPVDMVQDHAAIEVKGGLVSNSATAQHWRATIGETSDEEKAWIKTASSKDKKAYNLQKSQEILERKEEVRAKIEKETGEPVKAYTYTVHLNPQTKTADIYKFEGFHLRIPWKSPDIKSAYIASYKYKQD